MHSTMNKLVGTQHGNDLVKIYSMSNNNKSKSTLVNIGIDGLNLVRASITNILQTASGQLEEFLAS